MSSLSINIIDTKKKLENIKRANINVVVETLRTFVVSHFAFDSGVNEIIFVNNEKDAMFLKKTCK